MNATYAMIYGGVPFMDVCSIQDFFDRILLALENQDIDTAGDLMARFVAAHKSLHDNPLLPDLMDYLEDEALERYNTALVEAAEFTSELQDLEQEILNEDP
jgi:hypothetical protein